MSVLACGSLAISVVFDLYVGEKKFASWGKVVFVTSLIAISLSASIPLDSPTTLVVRHQQWTPTGLVQVLEDRSKPVAEMLLRLNSDIVGVVELRDNGSVDNSVNPIDAIVGNARFAHGLVGKRALVL